MLRTTFFHRQVDKKSDISPEIMKRTFGFVPLICFCLLCGRLVAQTEEAFEKFEKQVQRVPEILECHLMSGQFDYLLRVIAKDAEDYERIHRTKLARLPGIQRMQSSLALRTVKDWAGYPVL